MDSLTQAVLGAGIQGALLGRTQGRKALAYGALLGTLPDLDVMLSYPDPVSMMTYHRGFSHSVFVLTALAALLAWLIRLRWPRAPYTAGRLFLTLWLVLITHPVLDSFTVYGTQLFWPLAWTPESWSAVFIIDPVYTLPMLLAVIVMAWRGPTPAVQRALSATVLFGAAYLLLALGGRWHAENKVEAELSRQGVTSTRLLATPMPFNTLLWRVIAKTPGDDYYEAVTGWLDSGPPELLRQPLHNDLGRQLADQPLLPRLDWFTNGWLRYDEINGKLVVTDLRMGMPGHYTFRFVMGERDGDRFKAVVPEQWPSARGGKTELGLILRRIVDSGTPLPLETWSRKTVE